MKGPNYEYMSVITGRQGNWRIQGNKRDTHSQLPGQWLAITVVHMMGLTKVQTKSYINCEL